MDKITEALTDLIKATVTADIKANIIRDVLSNIEDDVRDYASEAASNEARQYLKYEMDVTDEIGSAVDNWMDYNLDVSDKVDDYMRNADFEDVLTKFFSTGNGRSVILDAIREGLKNND